MSETAWAGLLAAAERGLSVAAAVVALRGLPLAVAIARARSYPPAGRLLAALGYAMALFYAVGAGELEPGWLLAAYAYFSAAALSTYMLSGMFAAGLPAFASCCLLYFVAPVLAVPTATLPLAAIGWELSLAAYSVHAEAARAAERPGLRDCMFFLLVDPTLVYTRRGTRVSRPALHLRGLGRALIGVLAIAVADGLFEPLRETWNARSPAFALAACMSWIAAQYFAHSGRASVQIGLMRQLGIALPERYHHPFAARSPTQFWRRWNTYVGDWARSYVFRPLAFAAARRRRGSRTAVKAFALLSTFGAIGLLHDLHDVVVHREPTFLSSAWFALAGAVVLGWEDLARRAHGAAGRVAALLPRAIVGLAARAGMAALFVAFAALLQGR